MMKSIAILMLSIAFTLPGQAQDDEDTGKVELKGYVVDAMCAKGMATKEKPMEAAAKHTKECALEEGCAASGFGVFSDGKWYKFDEKGDALALELIKNSKTEKGMVIEAEGEMKENIFVVAEIEEEPMMKEEKQ
jgi:hypothetical protein